MSITIKSTGKKLETFALDVIAASIEILLSKQRRVVFAFPGGNSVTGIINQLPNSTIPWDKVHLFMADERVVSLDDNNSNFKQAQEGFINQLMAENGLPKKNIHPFQMDASESDYGLSYYNETFNNCGGKADIVLLSAGEDGHVASLFPNHSSMQNNSNSYIFVNDSPKPPTQRISLSKQCITQAEYVILLFLGEGKREAYRCFKSNDTDSSSCPAKLALSAANSFIFTDIEE